MILVDTSVWVDHFRIPEPNLVDLLKRGRALMHPFVLSEVLMGNLRDWARTIVGLQALPQPTTIGTSDLAAFIEDRNLKGSGLSFVDAHLLATVLREPTARLWTRDKRLEALAADFGLGWTPPGGSTL